MQKIHFVVPEEKYKELVLNYMQEHFDNGEEHLHGASMLETKDTYEEWLAGVIAQRKKETVQPNWVVSSTFLVMDEEETQVIGMIDVRHELNDFLRNYGGHIGYGVRPSQRRQGYATTMLEMALAYCKTLAVSDVMVSCMKHNQGSKQTILKCGGIIEREFENEEGIVQIYWINQ